LLDFEQCQPDESERREKEPEDLKLIFSYKILSFYDDFTKTFIIFTSFISEMIR
jgi:hypothetical protein